MGGVEAYLAVCYLAGISTRSEGAELISCGHFGAKCFLTCSDIHYIEFSFQQFICLHPSMLYCAPS
jgi:hypothetical protein